MRINVYGEELRPVSDDDGPTVELIHKQVVSVFKHSAIRILLGERIIHTEIDGVKDDDTPGITFWYADEYQRGLLVNVFEKALTELSRPEAKKE